MSTAIELTPGILPPPACYGTEQERHNAYTAAIVAELVSDPEWIVSATEPAPDENKHWLRLDTVTLRPIGAYDYVVADAAWVPWLWFSVTPNAVGGAANAYTITNTPAFTTVGEAYSLYRTYKFLANFSTTGASTLNVDGLGAKAIKIKVSEDTGVDTIKSGQIVEVVYDGTNFQMVSAVSVVSIVAEDIEPGDNDGDFLRTRDISGTLTAVWEQSDYTTTESAAVAIPAGGTPATFLHGLGTTPRRYGCGIILTDAGGDLGWSQGTYIDLSYTTQIDGGLSDDNAPTVAATSTTIVVQTMAGASAFRISDFNTGAVTAIDPTKWKLIAWAQI
jgi:hypothetical protein